MRNIFYSLRWVPVVLLALLLNACGMLTFSNLLGTNTLGGAATIAAEDLDVSEVELFDSGPVDIPVSIAKLDAPDVTLIDVSISDASLDDSSSLFLTRVRTLEADTPYTFTFTGLAGAANPTGTPYILVRNTQTGDYRVSSISATGTFSVALEGETEQDFTLQAITGTDLTTAKGSSALVIRGDPEGAVFIKTTNSNDLTPNMVIVVSNGFTFFSNLTADGTFKFWRRNLNGAQPTLLLSGIIYPIRLISVFADNSAVLLDNNGGLIMASNIGEASVSVQTLRGRSLEVDAMDGDLFSAVILDNFDFSTVPDPEHPNNDALPYSLITLPDQGALLVKQFAHGADEGTVEGESIVDRIGLEGQVTTFIPAVDEHNVTYDDVYVTYDDEAKQVIVAISSADLPDFDIFRVNMDDISATDSGELWMNQRQLVAPHVGVVRGMGANANVIIYSTNVSPTEKEFRLIRNGGIPETIVRYDQEDNPFTDIVKISPDGLFAVSCLVESRELYFIPLMNDPVPEPILFATPGICRMKDIFIDAQHRVFFYSTQQPTETIDDENDPAQLTFIDLDDVPIVQEALEQ